ncbi:MAG: RNase H family protein, partial [Gemmatimonadales bacterium]
SLPRPSRVRMVTDSQYLKNGITVWISRWLKNGWRNAQKKPLLNRDLWERLNELTRRHEVRWDWVRGHAGDSANERCHELVAEQMAGFEI